MKLNRWQRIGVVLSVVWALGAAYYERSSEMERGQKYMDWSNQVCVESNVQNKDCSKDFERNFNIWMKPNWGNIAFISLAPVPLGWGVILFFIRIYRWVKAGAV